MSLFYPLLSLGLLIEAGLLLLITRNNLSEQSGFYLLTFTVLFSLFALASYMVITNKFALSPVPKIWDKRLIKDKTAQVTGPATPAGKNKPDQKAVLVLIIVFAALFRLTAVFIAPTLSTDQFRYTWEGRLVTLGISPYRYAPDDPALIPFHSPIWPLVQQKETASPYPPLAQLTGAIEYSLLADSLFGPKIAAAFFELLVCLALLWLLGIFNLDLRRVILYAWCPLPVIEFGQSGHNDTLMLLLMLVAVGLALRKCPALSAFTLGLAILAKFTPLFALPLFLVCWEGGILAGVVTGTAAAGKSPVNWSWRVLLKPRYWRYPALTLAVVIAGYIPFLVMGQGAIGSIFEYTGTWRDNEGFIYQLAFQLGGIFTAKIVSLVILAGTVSLLSLHPRLASEITLPRRIMLVFGVTLLVASTVHSSYVSWLLVWLPLVWGKGFKSWDKAWLLFALLIQLYYLNYAPKPDFPLKFWINPLEYWPLHLLIGWNIYTWWKNGPAQAGKTKIVLKEGLSKNGNFGSGK